MSTPAKKAVELFYDVISPYTWIGFEVLCRYRQKWNIDLQFKPMFLGGIMQATGNSPPMMVPAKYNYMMQDLHRLSRYYQIPMGAPANVAEVLLTKGSLSAQRFLTAVQLTRPELVEHLSRELWMRVWSRDEDISTPDSLRQAGEKIGLAEADIGDALKRSKETAVKDRLKEVTQEVLDFGGFGSPTIIVPDSDNKKQMVFGSDRMHIIAMLLNDKYLGPLNELAATK